MGTKEDKDNWLKSPKKLELLKNIPLWNISDDKKKEKKIYELMYNSDLLISRVEYLLFMNDNYFFTGGRMVVSPNKKI